MKEIGASFKEKREEIGLSKEEASSDMGITIAQLDNLEDGSVNAFKDIFFLRDLVKKYTIYLNLDEDDVMEKFNEFVFDFTSKIPLDEIEAQVKEQAKEEVVEKKIASPYTIRNNNRKLPIIIYSILGFVLVIIIIFIINLLFKDKEKTSNMKEVVFSEFA